MRGSVIKRGKTWTYVLSLGRDPVTGRRRRKWVGGFWTRSACEGARVEALGRLRRGEYVGVSRYVGMVVEAAVRAAPQSSP